MKKKDAKDKDGKGKIRTADLARSKVDNLTNGLDHSTILDPQSFNLFTAGLVPITVAHRFGLFLIERLLTLK